MSTWKWADRYQKVKYNYQNDQFIPLSCKSTPHYLLHENGFGSFISFFFATCMLRFLSRGWLRDTAGRRGLSLPPFFHLLLAPIVQLPAGCVLTIQATLTSIKFQWHLRGMFPVYPGPMDQLLPKATQQDTLPSSGSQPYPLWGGLNPSIQEGISPSMSVPFLCNLPQHQGNF